MKLSLRHIDGVSVLDVSGDLDQRSFEVLKAGLSKLFRDGKNRIVLNLQDAQELGGNVIRELAILDVFARELSGKIVLASSSEDLRGNVRLFSRPPVVPIVGSVDLALRVFREQDAEEGQEASAELKAELDAKNREIASLEARLAKADVSQIRSLTSANASLKEKVALLEQQVERLTKEKRGMAEVEGFLEKIDALEAAVKRLAGSREQ